MFKNKFLAIFSIVLLILLILIKINIFTEPFLEANNYPNVYYINLKHRTDRKKHFLKQLNYINYPSNKIIRIDAVQNNIGTLGCLASHIKALKKGLNDGNDFCIILEDDFTFIESLSVTDINKTLIDCFNSDVKWNVILLSMSGELLENQNKNNLLLNIKHSQTTSGYIIKKTYIPVLLKLFTDLYRITKNYTVKPPHELCMDIHWKKLQDKTWFVTNPKLGIQYASYSDIENSDVDYNV
jgi:glycosyl transferase, family 25